MLTVCAFRVSRYKFWTNAKCLSTIKTPFLILHMQFSISLFEKPYILCRN